MSDAPDPAELRAKLGIAVKAKESKVAAIERFLGQKEDGEDWLWEQLSSLKDMSVIAKEIGCTPRALYLWRAANEERRLEWAASLRVSGDLYAEEGKRILDVLYTPNRSRADVLQSSEVALATARSRDRMKIAAARHPEAWGEKQAAPQVTINVGALHLEALKAHGSMTLQGKPVGLLAPPTEEEV